MTKNMIIATLSVVAICTGSVACAAQGSSPENPIYYQCDK